MWLCTTGNRTGERLVVVNSADNATPELQDTNLTLAIARLFETPNSNGAILDTSFHCADCQAITSLITFNAGAFLGRIGDRLGSHTRLWLVLGTFIQTLFTMAAAICIWQSGSLSIANDRGDPSWTNVLSFVALGFMSAGLGLQRIMGKRLNTQFTTTMVLTTAWVELVRTDPKLFVHERVKTRDHKLIAALSFFVGAFVSRAMLAEIGASGALGVATGVRVLVSLSWLFVPAKVVKERKK
ncbi:hypothetical protein K435DRAFT_822080 [Dendrothele bispora CBS 962.96]|uniref:DUF1275 domain protein n=1 Tax=Dendrothele bispora (strain CBS 962.96) TaxID=1314807 RepID=A0A4S8LCG6_DENBC|nr:hypothetical protein K435DRAFT_822080 [Dendrothele bispora CBS 962.96]